MISACCHGKLKWAEKITVKDGKYYGHCRMCGEWSEFYDDEDDERGFDIPPSTNLPPILREIEFGVDDEDDEVYDEDDPDDPEY